MLDLISTDREVARLDDALARQALPARFAKPARLLRDHLAAPVRITLMGPSETGKRALINALAGQPVLPPGRALPTSELRHGPAPLIRATLRDGTTQDFPGGDPGPAMRHRPSFLQFFAPAAPLRDIVLLNLVTDGSADQCLTAARWAARRSDIAIWVTPAFEATQQALWQQMPDNLRHHCFLAVAREGGGQGGAQVDPEAARLAEGTFLRAFAIAISPEDGCATGPGTDELWQEIERCAVLGRQADLDQAAVLLGHAKETPEPTPAPGDPAPMDVPSGADPRAVQSALDTLRSEARTMLHRIGAAPADVTAQCAETVERVSLMIPPGSALHDRAMQACDYLVLLQLEDDNAGAQQAAATVVLQLKREVEMAIAA